MSWCTRLPAIVIALLAAPVAAQEYTVVTEEWVETVPAGASRYVSPQQEQTERDAVDTFGPFRVLDDHTAALVSVTDSRSLAQFAAMLRAYPGIALIDFVEAPGTHDDVANMAIGRMIRDRGMATRVAKGGSVRSGAVELFLAGAQRSIAPDAEFAVHGWLDYDGRGASDYPAGAPEHRRYLDYYAEMGMASGDAKAFYAMTNSVPFEEALWLTGVEMSQWLGDSPSQPAIPADIMPRLAYLDLNSLDQSAVFDAGYAPDRGHVLDSGLGLQ